MLTRLRYEYGVWACVGAYWVILLTFVEHLPGARHMPEVAETKGRLCSCQLEMNYRLDQRLRYSDTTIPVRMPFKHNHRHVYENITHPAALMPQRGIPHQRESQWQHLLSIKPRRMNGISYGMENDSVIKKSELLNNEKEWRNLGCCWDLMVSNEGARNSQIRVFALA